MRVSIPEEAIYGGCGLEQTGAAVGGALAEKDGQQAAAAAAAKERAPRTLVRELLELVCLWPSAIFI
jgi:hypothetical protein